MPHPTCARKVGYANVEGALLVLMSEKSRCNDGRSLQVYRCPHCALFHLGHDHPGAHGHRPNPKKIRYIKHARDRSRRARLKRLEKLNRSRELE